MLPDHIAAAIDAAAAAQPDPRSVLPETVPERVVHVDGDYLAYFAAGGDDMEAGVARRVAADRIEAFREMSGSASATLHLTAAASTKGERFLIAQCKPYQGQRSGSKPKNWQVLRDYLERAEYVRFKRAMWHDREADDGMALAAYTSRDPLFDTVIATRDKDMRMLPGIHIDWTDFTLTQVPKGAYEVIGPYNGLVYGHKWFWLQMLQGDSADNIPGIPKIGEQKATDALAGTTCNEEAYGVVAQAYAYKFGPAAADVFVEQAALLWLRTTSNAPIADMLRVIPAKASIKAALDRIIHRVKEQRETLNRINAQAAAYEDAARAEQH